MMIATEATITKSFFAMGTVNSVTVYSEEHLTAAEQCRRRTIGIHNKMSAFDPESEISEINAHAGKSGATVSDETFDLIKRCVGYSELTGGRFDITAGPSSMLWKHALRSGTIPSDTEIVKFKNLIGYKNIILKNNVVDLENFGQKLDLGGVAKGHAADEARRILSDHGVDKAMINYGGTVIIMGETQSVGIRDPFAENGDPFAAIDVCGKAVVTSGSYEQSIRIGDKLYHHIIDPTTGKPSDSPFASITLIGDSAEELDAFATAVFCMTAEEASRFIQRNIIEAIFITNDRNVFITDGLRNDFQFI